MLFLRLPGYFASASPVSSMLKAVCSLEASAGAVPAKAAAAACPLQLCSLSTMAGASCATASAEAAQHERAVWPHERAQHRSKPDGPGSSGASRGFAATAAADSNAAEIFDRDLKRKHRDRAARLQSQQDPVLEAVSEGLAGRLDDCKRTFPVAAVINGAGENVIRQLIGGRAGIREVLLLDTSAEMLARAQRLEAAWRKSEPGIDLPKIRYVQADEEQLPLQPHSVDVIICPLGLHWVNDLPGALTQCRRALKPDGLLLGALLGGDSLQELRIACALAEQDLEGGVSPRISPLAQVRDAGNLLTRAGLSIPAVDVDDIVAMGESNAVRQATRTVRRQTAVATAQKYIDMFGDTDGTVPSTFQVIYLTGWSPHASQQRASRRGSATASFQDLERELKKVEPEK